MQTTQKRKILKKIQQLERDIKQLEQVRIALSSSEFASATMSSGSGSRSYTRADSAKVTTMIAELKAELKNAKKLLREEDQLMPRQIYTIYGV